MGLILLLVVIILLGGGGWGWQAGWHSSYPGPFFGGGALGLIVLVLVVLALAGRL